MSQASDTLCSKSLKVEELSDPPPPPGREFDDIFIVELDEFSDVTEEPFKFDDDIIPDPDPGKFCLKSTILDGFGLPTVPNIRVELVLEFLEIFDRKI